MTAHPYLILKINNATIFDVKDAQNPIVGTTINGTEFSFFSLDKANNKVELNFTSPSGDGTPSGTYTVSNVMLDDASGEAISFKKASMPGAMNTFINLAKAGEEPVMIDDGVDFFINPTPLADNMYGSPANASLVLDYNPLDNGMINLDTLMM